MRRESHALQRLQSMCRVAIHNGMCLAGLCFLLDGSIEQNCFCSFVWGDARKHNTRIVFPGKNLKQLFFSEIMYYSVSSPPSPFSCQLQVLHEPLIDEDPVFIATCTERELRKRKKRKFSLWVRQCSSTGFICQVGFTSSDVLIQFQQALKCITGPKVTVTPLHCLAGSCNLNMGGLWLPQILGPKNGGDKFLMLCCMI